MIAIGNQREWGELFLNGIIVANISLGRWML